MKSEIDVLIIFTSRDNESGWVSQFKRFLELMLLQVLGEKPNVLLKDEIDTLTSPNLDNAATLITILSKNFIQSGQCLDHLETFVKASASTSRKINRIFKVFKSPLSQIEQPPRLRELMGFEMYQLDPNSGETSEYTDYFTSEAEKQYWMKMVDLAYDIYDALLQLKGDPLPISTRLYNRKTIYLAETGHDMTVQRNIIKRELQRHGYVVLPKQMMVGNVSEIETTIRKDLEECNLSIHLIGAAYGEIPEGSDKSLPELQLTLAAERNKMARESNTHFSRLVWLSPNPLSLSERQRMFVERINADVESLDNTEILQMPIEDFKVIMHEELMERADRSPVQRPNERTIYLMHDRVDHDEAKHFASLIETNGFRVLLPAFEGDVMEVRKKHIENLIDFDVALIFRGRVNEQWVRMKVLDLLKAPGYGRRKPIIGKAIISIPGPELNPEAYRKHDLEVIQGGLEKSLESLKNLLQDIGG
ncbi:MAG TPA: hypothetical protein VFW11_08850 [Cyclobacteriaceae bacterium]|nr:hypothetical protein [Cyclobacteriaceae bacterium]